MTNRTNQEWREQLTSEGGSQARALADLRALLLRGALFALRRTRYDLGRFDREAILQLAEDSAQEALVAVLEHLPAFRGESKFTTWAYKFAINIALVQARHISWKWVSLDASAEDGDRELDFVAEGEGSDPIRAAWQSEVRGVIQDVIRTELSARQRQVLVALVFEEAPLDEVARLLGTNRNAVYKLMHDARVKLKDRLAARGLLVPEILDLFSRP